MSIEQLYQTNKKIESLMSELELVCNENGMIVDEELYESIMERIGKEKEAVTDYLLDIGHSIKKCKSEIDMISAEEKRFASKKKQLHFKIEFLKNAIKLNSEPGEKASDGLVSIGWQGEWQLIIDDKSKISHEYWKSHYQTNPLVINKPVLIDALKSTRDPNSKTEYRLEHESIPGAHLERITKLQVK